MYKRCTKFENLSESHWLKCKSRNCFQWKYDACQMSAMLLELEKMRLHVSKSSNPNLADRVDGSAAGMGGYEQTHEMH